MRIARQDRRRLPVVGDTADNGQRLAEPVELVQRRAVQVAGGEAAVHAFVGQPELLVDCAFQLQGPARVARGFSRIALFARQLRRQLERLEDDNVGRQRLRAGHRRQVTRHPRGVGLVAPVEERFFARVQARGRVERRHAVDLECVRQRRQGLAGECRALGSGQCAQRLFGREGPRQAVGADRPAAAAAGVLHDLQAVRRGRDLRRRRDAGAPARQLEVERIAHALRVEQGQAQVGRVRQVARPDIRPLLAGGEAVAIDGVAAVVVAVLDLADRIEAHLGAGQREQRVKGEVAGAGARQAFLLGVRDMLRTGIAQAHRARLDVLAEQRLGIRRRVAHRLGLAVPRWPGLRGNGSVARMRIGRVGTVGIGKTRDLQRRFGRIARVQREAVGARCAHEQERLGSG